MSEVILTNIEISPEAEPSKMPQKAQTLAEQAWHALRDQDGRRAQELLEQALALAPDDPSLINNLALALSMQDQGEKATRMALDLHERFPDYFFGTIAAASHELLQGNLERSHELLDGLMQRKKMHTSEFTALCRAQIQVSLAEGNRQAARYWLDAWEKVDPDHPDLKIFQRKVGPAVKK